MSTNVFVVELDQFVESHRIRRLFHQYGVQAKRISQRICVEVDGTNIHRMMQNPIGLFDKEGRRHVFMLDETRNMQDKMSTMGTLTQAHIQELQRQIALLSQIIADQKVMYAQEIRRLNIKLQEMWKDSGEVAMYFSTPPSSPDPPPPSPDPPPPSPIKM